MKILFVAQNLQMGGIQKALINTLKELSDNEKYEIDVFSFGKGILMNEIPSGINVFTGNLALELISTPFNEVKKTKNILHLINRIFYMIIVRLIGSRNFYRLLFASQKKFKGYNVAISYFNDVASGYFNKGTNLFVDEIIEADKKIAWIHTDPIEARFDYQSCLNIYEKYDSLVCVSKAVKQKFADFLPEYKEKMNVVYNFFPTAEIRKKSLEYTPFKKGNIDIVSVGRIDNSTKRFNLIPQICKMLKDSCTQNFRWRVVGNGPHLEENKKLVDDLGISDVVEFVGEYENPYPFIKESDLLILTSAYEGYPMVIGEALILGVPVITTNFAAACEQVKSGYNGMVTDSNLEDIYITIKSVIENTQLIDSMKQYIVEHEYSNRKAKEQLLMELENVYD